MAFDPSQLEIGNVADLPDELKTKKERDADKKAKKPKKRRKITYSKSKLGKLAPARVINKYIVAEINKEYLLDKPTKLKVSDCEIGEATMYMIEYYADLDINHPALIFFGAALSLGFTVMQLAEQKDKQKEGQPREPDHEDKTITIRAEIE